MELDWRAAPNDNLDEAVEKMAGIVAAEQCRVCRQDESLKNLK